MNKRLPYFFFLNFNFPISVFGLYFYSVFLFFLFRFFNRTQDQVAAFQCRSLGEKLKLLTYKES